MFSARWSRLRGYKFVGRHAYLYIIYIIHIIYIYILYLYRDSGCLIAPLRDGFVDKSVCSSNQLEVDMFTNQLLGSTLNSTWIQSLVICSQKPNNLNRWSSCSNIPTLLTSRHLLAETISQLFGNINETSVSDMNKYIDLCITCAFLETNKNPMLSSGFKFCLSLPLPGDDDPIWRLRIFFKVQPPTRKSPCFFSGIWWFLVSPRSGIRRTQVTRLSWHLPTLPPDKTYRCATPGLAG